NYSSLLALVLLFQFFIANAVPGKKATATDTASGTLTPYPYEHKAEYKGIDYHTYYITMRDSVKIAVDLYLPKKLEADKKIPAIMHQTRYWRRPQLRWPFSMFTKGLIGRQGKIIKDIVAQGYAVVNVDSRGSGASFGNRAYPWTMDEIKDGAEIVDWIIEQEWSSGKVGAIGASYSGTTAEFLTINQHPAVEAVILLYSLFDVYEDIAFPGGIFHEFFVKNWGAFNAKLDQSKLPRGGFIAKLLVKGVARVKTDNKRKTFRNALEDHKENLQVSETSEGVEYRDQAPTSGVVSSSDVFSPHNYTDKVDASGAAVYSYSGWMDGDYQHSCIKRHLTLSNPENKLTLGPWEHGGKYNCSPYAPSEAGFNHTAEFLKFFDYHLKGMENGLYDEPKIHYYTVGEEKWKSSESWPPKTSNEIKFYFNEEQKLSESAPESEEAFDVYVADTTALTGDDSRWKSMIGMLKTPHVYPDRKEQQEKLMIYHSEPLDEDLTISGHPIANLLISSDQPDGNFHVYLEEIAPDGKVRYITEGLLRGIHRKVSSPEDCPYKDAVPCHTYLQEDASLMEINSPEKLVIDLLPISYRVPKGHRLAVSLAAADKSHFAVMHKAIAEWKIHRSNDLRSYIQIPVE
ncbi:MAG: CocE/NonD family hydrolase, partial [Chitinophagales bacterium]